MGHFLLCPSWTVLCVIHQGKASRARSHGEGDSSHADGDTATTKPWRERPLSPTQSNQSSDVLLEQQTQPTLSVREKERSQMFLWDSWSELDLRNSSDPAPPQLRSAACFGQIITSDSVSCSERHQLDLYLPEYTECSSQKMFG